MIGRDVGLFLLARRALGPLRTSLGVYTKDVAAARKRAADAGDAMREAEAEREAALRTASAQQATEIFVAAEARYLEALQERDAIERAYGPARDAATADLEAAEADITAIVEQAQASLRRMLDEGIAQSEAELAAARQEMSWARVRLYGAPSSTDAPSPRPSESLGQLLSGAADKVRAKLGDAVDAARDRLPWRDPKDFDDFGGAAPAAAGGGGRASPAHDVEIPGQGPTNVEMLGGSAGDRRVAAIIARENLELEEALKAGIYTPQGVRSYLLERGMPDAEIQQRFGIVGSKTIPAPHLKNVKLAGRRHPKTNVLFDERGYPVFEGADLKVDHRFIDPDFARLSPRAQSKRAAIWLAGEIDAGRITGHGFSAEELDRLRRGVPLKKWVWHHHQESGRMQLVDRDQHAQAGHIGGIRTRRDM